MMLGCASGSTAHDEARSHTVRGRVVLNGPVPRSWLASEDAEYGMGERSSPPEGWTGLPPQEIEVTPDGGVRGVAVWLEPIDRADPRPADYRGNDSAEQGSEPIQVIRLEGGCFWPSMIVVPSGGTVRFVNADARLHHIQTISGNAEIGVIVPGGEAADVTFTEPGNLRLSCNDHAFMRADLIVTPTPWFALTDAEGDFLIPNAPGGTCRLRVAHHRLRIDSEAVWIDTRSDSDGPVFVPVIRGAWDP